MANISNRTFGVEFEVFFFKKDIQNLIADNIEWFDNYQKQEFKFLSDSDKINYRKRISNEIRGGIPYWYHLNDDGVDLSNYSVLKVALYHLKLSSWSLHDDNSIQGGDYQIEIVTPILQGQGGINQVEIFCNFFKNYANVNNSTGLHVHVGARDFISNSSTIAQNLTLALLYHRSFEDLFDKLVEAYRRKNKTYYATSSGRIDEIIGNYKKIIKTDTKDLDKVIEILSGGTRYKKLNLESLLKYGTIEFRQLQGTLNPTLVKNWIILCMSFLDMINHVKNDFTTMFSELEQKSIKEKENKEYEISNISSENIEIAQSNLITELISFIKDKAEKALSHNQGKTIFFDESKIRKNVDFRFFSRENLAQEIPLNTAKIISKPFESDSISNVYIVCVLSPIKSIENFIGISFYEFYYKFVQQQVNRIYMRFNNKISFDSNEILKLYTEKNGKYYMFIPYDIFYVNYTHKLPPEFGTKQDTQKFVSTRKKQSITLPQEPIEDIKNIPGYLKENMNFIFDEE